MLGKVMAFPGYRHLYFACIRYYKNLTLPGLCLLPFFFFFFFFFFLICHVRSSFWYNKMHVFCVVNTRYCMKASKVQFAQTINSMTMFHTCFTLLLSLDATAVGMSKRSISKTFWHYLFSLTVACNCAKCNKFFLLLPVYVARPSKQFYIVFMSSLAFIMLFGTVEGLDSRNVAFPEYLFYFLFYFDLGMLLCNLNLQHNFTIDLL